MSDWKDLYPRATTFTSSSLAPITTPLEAVDLRVEFDNLIHGGGDDTPIGQPLIFRRMRRDDNEALIPCSCLNDTTKEPRRDFICYYCFGRGYLWDEELVAGYKTDTVSPGGTGVDKNLQKKEYGFSSMTATRFYFSYDLVPTKDDRIVELELDSAGDAILPYNRLRIYELVLVRDIRGDNGKIEYWICYGEQTGPSTHGIVG